MKERFLRGWGLWRGVVLSTILLVLAYWVIESAAHTLVFDERPFLEQVFSSNRHEIGMRVSGASLLALVGVVSQLYVRRRQRLTDELRASEQEKKMVLDSLVEVVTYQERDLRVVWANRAALELAKEEGKTLIGRRCYEAWYGRDKPCEGCPVEESVKTGRLQEREMTSSNGRTWLIRGVPIRNDSGSVVGAVETTLEITDRKKAEKELRQSKGLLQAIQESTGDGLLITDLDCNVTWHNREVELFNGRIVGKKCYEVFEGRTSRCPHCVHPAVLADGKTRGYETTVRTSAGDVNVWVRATPLRDASGRIVGILEASRNIGERKRAEEELRRQRDKAQEYLDVAGVVILAVGADERVTLINRKGCEVLGAEEEEIVGRNWFDRFLPERLREEVRKVFREIMSGSAAPFEYFENPVKRANGEERIIAWHNTVLKDETGAITGTLSSGLDITEQESAAEALRASEELLRQMAENVREVFWLSDPKKTHMAYVSPAYEEIWGRTCESLYENPRSFLDAVLPEYREVVFASFEEQSTGKAVDIEYRISRPDGSVRWIRSQGFPIKNEKGEVYRVAGIAEDVTERRRRENQNAQEQKLQSIGQLAAGIAHEINTPTQYVGDNTRFLQDAFQSLSGLLNKYAELLTACKEAPFEPDLVEEVEKAVGTADLEYLDTEIPRAFEESMQGIERVSKIVKSMKEFAHPDSGEKVPVDINRSIESTVTVSRNEWKYVANMVTDFSPDLPLVPCLQSEFNQVILNMVVNAAHAIADIVGDGSGGKGTITVSTRRDGDWAEVRIGDTGTGISQEHRAKVFDPFFTTKEVGRGTGQGLAIAYDVIVEKHGGTIAFETEEGKGTTFIIRLPLGGNLTAEEVGQESE